MKPQARATAALVMALGATFVVVGQQPTFKATVDLVRVDVLVTQDGRPIRDLTGDDFELRDNGRVQQIDAIFSEVQPLDVVLVLDVSDSVQGIALARLKQAALAAVDSLQADDRAQLVAFSHRITLGSFPTIDREPIRREIDRLAAHGGTSVYDALYGALAMGEDHNRRRMILLFSDGRDNRSWLSSPDVVQVARESNTVVYAVAYKQTWQSRTFVGPAAASNPDEALLTSIASGTGGRLIVESDSGKLTRIFTQVVAEMRDRYVLTFYPGTDVSPGWHTLSVRLKRRSGTIVTRQGYLVR